MKVAIREQIDIEDEQRVQLADILDSKQSKRQATREEIKDFVWALGSEWDVALHARWGQLFGEALFQEGTTPGAETLEQDESTADVDEPDAAPDEEPEDAEEDLLGLADMSPEEAMEALL